MLKKALLPILLILALLVVLAVGAYVLVYKDPFTKIFPPQPHHHGSGPGGATSADDHDHNHDSHEGHQH
jgi:ABC-type nickel/cobalt efflux system permease component RcnA